MSAPLHEEEELGKAYDGRLMRRFLAEVRPRTPMILLALLLGVAKAACDVATAPILKEVVDGPVARGDLGGLAGGALLFLAAIVGMALFEFLEIIVLNLLGQRVILDLRMKVFAKLQRLPLPFFDRNPVGRLMIRVTSDVENLNELLTSGLVAVVADVFLIVGVLGMMFWTSWRMALVTLAPMPLMVVAVLVFRRIARGQYREVRVKIARLNSYLNECVNGMRTIRLFGRGPSVFARFAGLASDYRDASNRTVVTYSVFYPVVDVIGACSAAILLAYGGLSILEGSLSFGAFLAFWYLAQKFLQPVRDLSEKYNVLQAAMASGERIFLLLDEPSTQHVPAVPASPPPRGELVFEDVRFSYDGKTPVLDGVSFRVAPGESVALVGVTGAGKTTITSLLLRLYDVTGGRILVDGVDVREQDPEALRRRFGLVLQDVFLFAGSVRDNLRLGDASLSDARLREALRAAGAEGFVDRLPGGLDADVRERGSVLSAGQRQLLSVARALAFDRPILILDEATSSVDSETEATIQAALEKLLAGRSSVVVAHRLSTIRHVDRILVLQNGRLVEEGPHAELVKRDGLYAKLCRIQFGAAPA